MDAVKTVQQAIDYMEERLGDKIDPERVAEAAYLSLPHLYRAFYALTGHPLMEYIRKRRASRAAAMLRFTGDPVLQIALECGFDSYRTFAAVFKKLSGLSPGAYRRGETIYSFERVDLLEQVRYCEDRELSGRYPDVKVIRLAPMPAVAFRYRSAAREGMENEALAAFSVLLEEAGIDRDKARLFGIDRSGPNDGDYELLTPKPEGFRPTSGLYGAEIPGGLYAEGRAPAGPASAIVGEWNRLLSEWLPKSSFEWDGRDFMEEFLHLRGKPTRLRLYLPVGKKRGQEPITIVQREPVRVLVFRAEGAGAREAADRLLTAWLLPRRGVWREGHRRAVMMSSSYGESEAGEAWCELSVALPEGFVPDGEANGLVRTVDGGLYARMTTKAYGAMTGVLDRLHRWLARSDGYGWDERRGWFVEYEPAPGNGEDVAMTASCYLPVTRIEEGDGRHAGSGKD